MEKKYDNLNLVVRTNYDVADVQHKGLTGQVWFDVLRGINHPEKVGTFAFCEYPHCCGIVVSVKTHVLAEHRGNGYSTKMQIIKEDLAREFGYGCIQATVEATNAKELAVLFKTGWKVIDQFKNPRTKHDLYVFRKVVK